MQTPDTGQETETKVIWPRLKIFWSGKDDNIGHSERQSKRSRDRQKKWCEDNTKKWTGARLGQLKTG